MQNLTVPPIFSSSHKAAASALGKMGEVHLSFITSYDPSHSFLAPFNLHRQVLGVLGLSTFNTQTSLEEVEHSPAALRQLHPSAVIHRVFAFDLGASRPQTVDLSSLKSSAEEMGQESSGPGASASQTSGPSARTGFSGRGTSGLIIFPAVRKDQRDVRFYLKTLLPDFVSALLDGLDTIVNGLQGKVLETPRETLDGSVTSPAALSPTPSKVIGAAGLAVGSAASRASALFSSFSAEEKKSNQRSSKANQSIASSGPLGAGRYAKMKADYYLLVGDLWNALHTYDSCMSLLGKERAIAGGQDAVWYASALEGWAVARFLVARMGGGVEEKVRTLCTCFVARSCSDSRSNRLPASVSPWAAQRKRKRARPLPSRVRFGQTLQRLTRKRSPSTQNALPPHRFCSIRGRASRLTRPGTTPTPSFTPRPAWPTRACYLPSGLQVGGTERPLTSFSMEASHPPWPRRLDRLWPCTRNTRRQVTCSGAILLRRPVYP